MSSCNGGTEQFPDLQSLAVGLVEASFDPMFQIDQVGVIQLVNQAAVDQFGWTREEFVGQNISMIVGSECSGMHDMYIKKYLATGEKRVMGKRRELIAKRKDGSEFPIELGLTEVKTKSGLRHFCGFVRDLTLQKKHEADLARKENLTMGLIDSSIDPMLQINEDGIIQLVNQAAVQQFGWSREEFIGKNIRIIVGGGRADRHDEYIRRYLATGEKRAIGRKRELFARRKDGSEFPIELGLTEVSTQAGERFFCGFVRDLTRQKKDEETLKQREKFTETIIEASFDAMLAIDEHGIIQRANAASSRQFGWSRGELIGQNVSKIMPSLFAEKQDGFPDGYMETGVAKMVGKQTELTGLRKDGSTFPLLLGLTQVEGPEGAPMFAAFLQDLTNQKKMIEVEIEKTAAEVLLLNVLPREIAFRLKEDPSHIADHHKSATILFADIVGFTSRSSLMSPMEVVQMLNDIFSMFDDLVEKYDLNKVKTIGDCYMVTSVPAVEHEENECSRVCHFALDMMEAIIFYNEVNPGEKLSMRVGINAGPVVAGVVGTKRFLYDLWGDAVNTASRMESTGVPGKIQVTKDIVDLVGDCFNFESRGLVHVKGKGEMETSFLTGRKSRRSDFFSGQSKATKKATSRKERSMSLLDSLKALEASIQAELMEDSTMLDILPEDLEEQDCDE